MKTYSIFLLFMFGCSSVMAGIFTPSETKLIQNKLQDDIEPILVVGSKTANVSRLEIAEAQTKRIIRVKKKEDPCTSGNAIFKKRGYTNLEIERVNKDCYENKKLKAIPFKKYSQWLNSSGYIINGGAYYCSRERTARKVANAVIRNKRITRKALGNVGCYLLKQAVGAKFISLSEDRKIAKIITHRMLYNSKEKVTLKIGYIPSNYLESLKDYNARQF